MLASVWMVSSGGMSSPFLRSLVRFPVTVVATVTMSTRYPAATARSTRSLFIPLSRWMYSWNHRSGRPGGRSGLVGTEDTAAARSSIVVVAIVDNAYGSPYRSAARAAAISPPGCIIRVYPVGASASGSGRSCSSSRRSEEHTSELQSQSNLVCRLLLDKKKKNTNPRYDIKKKINQNYN